MRCFSLRNGGGYQGEGDRGLHWSLVVTRQFVQEPTLKIVWIDRHFACSDFLFRGALKAEFTHAQTAFCPYGWPEGAACKGSRRVKIAEASRRVERRAGFVIGEILETSDRFRICKQLSGDRIAGVLGRQAPGAFARTFADAGGTRWLPGFQVT